MTKNEKINFEVAKAFRPPFDLVMSTKNMLLISIGVSSVLFLCSCDKPKLLMDERKQVESEITRLLDEAKSLDDKSLTLGTNALNMRSVFERHNAELTHKNAMLEKELAALSKKCSEGEAAVNSLRPRLDAYKARIVR